MTPCRVLMTSVGVVCALWMAVSMAACDSSSDTDGGTTDVGAADVGAEDAGAADAGAAGDDAATTADGGASEPQDEVADDPDPEPVVLGCADQPACVGPYCEQVLIETSQFPMGHDQPPPTDTYWPAGDARPIHDVEVSTFCMDKYEVTLQRYEACVDAGACSPQGLQWQKADTWDTTVNHYPEWCWGNLDPCQHHAVNGKNYWQAENYCDWVGGRLCTEAEWERAANGPGPDRRAHPWGNEPANYDRVNIPSTGPGWINPVDDHAPGQSADGIYNLEGNVYEWVADAFAPYTPAEEGPLVDPMVPSTALDDEFIGRGSCFFTEPKRSVTDRTRFEKTFDWG